MRRTILTSLLAATLFSTPALADDSQPTRAAGWAVLGIGVSLGAGSITTGAVLAGESYPYHQVGIATLAGGAVTTGLSLLIGIPLILSSDDDDDKKRSSAERYTDALSGTIRW
jgi:hypothetical protein